MSKNVAFGSHDARAQVVVAAAEPAVAEEDDEVVVHLVQVVMGEPESVRQPIYLDAKVEHRPLKASEGAG